MGSTQKRLTSGYTLIEMIMVILILTVLGSVSAYVIVEATSVYARTAPADEAAHRANLALERMRREIRAIRTLTAGDVPTFTATTLSFVDTDGATVSFSLSGTTLSRGSDILAEGVTALTFSYFKTDGTAAGAATEINLIAVALEVTSGTQSVSLTTQIYPRNTAGSVSDFKEIVQ